jgi:DNA-binding transcriptional LysR family regulator
MSDLDLRQLRYFVAIAEEQIIGRAAQRLQVTQPAVSRQLKLLERAIGAELVERHAKGVELTPAGHALLSATRQILAQIDAAALRAQRAARGIGGSVRLGIGRGTLTSDLAQDGLAAIRSSFPDIEITVEDLEAGPAQWRGLLSHSVDIVLGVEPPPDLRGIATERIVNSTLEVALVSSTHPLAMRPVLRPRDLSPYPMIWVPRAHYPQLYDALMAERARLGITSPVVDTYSGVYAMLLAVATGQGWQPLPQRYLWSAPDGTVARPVDGMSVPLWEAIMWRVEDGRPVIQQIAGVFSAILDGKPLTPPAPAEPETPRTRGLELHHLRSLAALMEEAGWTRGAQRLGVAPSVLFRHIEELERELDLRLFDRLPRGVRPTDAGTSLATDAPRLLAAVDLAVSDATRISRLHGRKCVLSGVDVMHASPVMREVLRRCEARFPEIEIALEELPTPDQVAALRGGRIDLGVGHVHASVPPDIRRLRIASYVFDSALLALDHPLAGRATLGPADLADVPFLFLTRTAEPHFHDSVMRALARAGFEPRTVQTFDSLHTARVVALKGGGWTLGVRRHYTGLVAVRLERLAMPSGLELLSRLDEQHPTVRIMLDLATEVVNERKRRAS